MTTEAVIIPLKSVIMTIGPSGSGKSFFIKNKLIPELRRLVPNANIQILSSDAYRREILGMEEKDIPKTDDRMKYASDGAFKLMETKFDAVTTWPVTADFVILDATFIGEKNRRLFAGKAKTAQYQLIGFLFDFDDREEYFKYIEDVGHRQLIAQHVKRFKKEMGELGRKDFDHIYRIKSKNHEVIIESDDSYGLMKIAKLEGFNSYLIVGDLHGCLKEFKELLIAVGFKIEGNRIIGRDDMLIVSVGDTVDKGNETAELIDFIYTNMGRMKICIAGHDKHLINLIKENSKNSEADNAKVDDEKYFDSISKLSVETLSKFSAIMEKQCHFYAHNNFVVTHAPTENKYIGKFDAQSAKKQRSHRYSYREEFESDDTYIETIAKEFSFVFDEARKYDPFHIFGHVALTDRVVIGNKVFLDTGCVYGNKLTGVVISMDNPTRLFFTSVNSGYPKNNYIINHLDIQNIRDKGNDIKFESLEFDDKIDILEFAKNRVNFISGTMSPCVSNKKEKTLEDISEAIFYYKDNGIQKVILQKKYMGSRTNMYLFPNDIDKSYMTSRNGFVIRRLDLKHVYEKMLKFLTEKDNDNKKNQNNENRLNISSSKLIIIDGELMPWSALGKGLIESHFTTVGNGVKSELQLLDETGFETYLKDLNKKYDQSGFKEFKKEHKKDELIEIMGDNIYRQMSSFYNFRWIPVETQKTAIDVYNMQMAIYGKLEGELDFKPFAVLKIVRDNLSEELFDDCSNEFVFTSVSDDEYLIVSTNEEGIKEAREWFDKIVSDNYEGVVMKPFEKVRTHGVAPYMKVRNPNYLTIIYGYDYSIEPKFTRMVESKNIRNKLRTSIKEFDLGRKMLEIQYEEINENNVGYLDLCAQMVMEEKKEKVFDPRL